MTMYRSNAGFGNWPFDGVNCLHHVTCLSVLTAGLLAVASLQTPAHAQVLSIGLGGIQYNGYGPGYYNGYGYSGYGPQYRPFAPRAALYSGYGNGAYAYGNAYPYYGYRPYGWRLGPWGLGALGYSNPYYTNSDGSFGDYNYSRPIPVTSRDPMTTSANPACVDSLENAIAAFKQADYDASLDLVNKGIVQCPGESVMHELRALALFAKGDYQQAASTLHSVLAVGPGWNWSTLSSLYPNVPVYTAQLRSLEAYTKVNPQDAGSQFLLAYHYMADGYPDAAERVLQRVVKLVPKDRVAADVLTLVSKPAIGQSAATGDQPELQPSAATTPTSTPIDPAMILGIWQASRNDGSQFEMTLKNDATFNWKFTLKGKVEEFGGTYKLEGNILRLERKDGGALVAAVVPDGASKFNFKLRGAPQEDPGLNFSK